MRQTHPSSSPGAAKAGRDEAGTPRLADNTGRIVGKTLDGKRLVFEHDLGGMCIGPESDFENIPEPKIMGRREAFLGPDGELYWVSSWPGNHPIDILGRTWVEITEGDGMEES